MLINHQTNGKEHKFTSNVLIQSQRDKTNEGLLKNKNSSKILTHRCNELDKQKMDTLKIKHMNKKSTPQRIFFDMVNN